MNVTNSEGRTLLVRVVHKGDRYMTTAYVLRIYDSSATQIVRQTEHATRKQALRSVRDFERRHGRAPHAIDAVTGKVAS